VEQILTNLLSNAIKYGGGQPVEVTVSVEGASARLAICDQGIGISAEEVERIFLRFERGASLRQYAGLGLGLYIARNLAEAHGGSIRVTSTPNLGSTFTVELPLRPPQDSRSSSKEVNEVIDLNHRRTA
jgi:signal transduction histidine kinase